MNELLNMIPQKFEPAMGNVWLHGVVIDLDRESTRSVGIERIAVLMTNILGQTHEFALYCWAFH